jgi:hypothetical protein
VIVGLLADEERRRVTAAVVLGATSVHAVAEATGLTSDRASRALGRLAEAGLVVDVPGRGLSVDGAVFQQAARTARARPPSANTPTRPASAARCCRRSSATAASPRSRRPRTKRLVLLDWVVQAFEPGVRYTERDVNELLAARHPDTAMLRRYLVDEGLLDRAGGEYWRSGGTWPDDRAWALRDARRPARRDAAEIREAYRSLARRYHPDHEPGRRRRWRGSTRRTACSASRPVGRVRRQPARHRVGGPAVGVPGGTRTAPAHAPPAAPTARYRGSWCS